MLEASGTGAAALLVARQPIVDRASGVVAYELLARRRLSDVTWDGDGSPGAGSATTARVIAQAFLDMDIWSITEGLPAFINVPRELLVDGTVERLPATVTVVEILESVPPDPEVLRACERLRARGYRLALDDVVSDDRRLALLDHVDVVKVDFGATTAAERIRIIERCRDTDVTVLAEKVETPTQHAEAVALGYDLFQGFFFFKPAVLDGRRPSVARLQHLQLLRSVLDPTLDRAAVGDVLARDPGAVARLGGVVRALDSDADRDLVPADEPLRALDDRRLQRYGALLVVLWLAERHPRPLRDTALIRGWFCERIVAHLDTPTDPLDAWFVGLCSVLDALVDEPLSDVLTRIRPPAPIAAALRAREGLLGDVLDLVIAYEHGEWEDVRCLAAVLGLDGDALGAWYLECLAWTRRTVARLADRSA